MIAVQNRKGYVVMLVKMMVSDMDGTLLNSERKLSAINKAKIRQAVNNGLLFTVATGRMYRAALPYVEQLGLDDIPLITHNGAVIKTTGGKLLAKTCLEPELVAQVIDFAEKLGFYVHVYTENDFIYRKSCKESKWYEDAVHLKGIEAGDKFKEYNQGIAKILIMDMSLVHVKEIMNQLKAKFGDSLHVQNSDPSHVEIAAPGVSKAAAMLKVAAMYDIKQEEIAAIGDSGNDVPMLKAAGIGIAVANASDEAKKAAAYQVGTNNENGVAQAINRFLYLHNNQKSKLMGALMLLQSLGL